MEEKQNIYDSRIFNLYKYFIWADRMKASFELLFEKNIKGLLSNTEFEIEYNLYMSYWFASLYIVIEGWQELKLKDKNIDSLLDSPNVNLLRRYRNGVFHFQKDYFDERFMGFMRDGLNRIKWIRELHENFSNYFEKYFSAHQF